MILFVIDAGQFGERKGRCGGCGVPTPKMRPPNMPRPAAALMPNRAVRRDSLLAIMVSIGVEAVRMDLDELVEFVSHGLAHRRSPYLLC